MLLLLIGAVLGYPFRPLNAVEQKIVGTWKVAFDKSNPPILVVFNADRTFHHRNAGPDTSGSWSASDDQIWIIQGSPPFPNWYVRIEWKLRNWRLWLTPAPTSMVELSDKRFVMEDFEGGVIVLVDRVPNDE